MSNGFSRRRLLMLVLPFLAIAVTGYVLVFAQARDSFIHANARQMIAMQRGTQGLSSDRYSVIDNDGGVAFGFDGHRTLKATRATWTYDIHTMRELAQGAGTATLDLFVFGDNLHADNRGRVNIYIDNRKVDAFNVDTPSAAIAHQWVAPNLRAMNVQLSGDFVTPAFYVPIDTKNLSNSSSLKVTISTHGSVAWDIRRIGIILRFTPEHSFWLLNPNFTIPLAGLLICVLIVCVAFVADRGFRIAGIAGGLLVTALYVLGIVSHDASDFACWIQLMEIGTFGGGSPVYYWTATPLWAFLPGTLAPLEAAASLLHVNMQVVAYAALKIVMVSAYVATIQTCALFHEKKPRDFVFFASLLAPYALYCVLWGARDLISGYACIAAIAASLRGRYLVGAILSAAALSIDEYYLPIAAVPALMYLLTHQRTLGTWMKSVGMFLVPVFLFVTQWMLMPKDYAAAVLSFRLDTNFREWTWQYVMDQMHILPAFLQTRHLQFFESTYAILLLVVSVASGRYLLGRRVYTVDQATSITLRAALGGVAAFLLTYGQVDPQEWFGIFLIPLLFGGLRKEMLAFSLLFGAVAGLELYAHFGLAEFTYATLFSQYPEGVFTLRGALDAPLITTCISFIVVAFAYALAPGRFSLTSGRTIYCFGAWWLIWLGSAQAFRLADLLVLGSFAAISVILFAASTDCVRPASLFENLPSRSIALLGAASVCVVSAVTGHWQLLSIAIATFVALGSARTIGVLDALLVLSSIGCAVSGDGNLAFMPLYPIVGTVIACLVLRRVAIPRSVSGSTVRSHALGSI